MARSEDFFVEFGSDAKQFAAQLKRDLAPAHGAISELRQALAALNNDMKVVANNGGNLAKAAGLKPPTDPGERATGGTGGGNGGIPDGLFRDFVRIEAELGNMVDKIGSVVDGVQKVGKSLQDERKSQNISEAAKRRQDRLANSETGRFAKANDPKAVRQSSMGISQAPTRNITGVPKALIDEASFTRVVDAVNRNVEATRRVERAILAQGRRNGGNEEELRQSGRRSRNARREQLSEATGGTLGGTKADRSAINELKTQINNLRRLTALKTERERVQTGGDFDPALFEAAADGSRSLIKGGKKSKYSGDAYAKQLDRAIAAAEKKAEQVDSLEELEAELTTRLEALGSGAPKEARAQRRAAKASRNKDAGVGKGAPQVDPQAERNQRLDRAEKALQDIRKMADQIAGALQQKAEDPQLQQAMEQVREQLRAAEQEVEQLKAAPQTRGDQRAARRAEAARQRQASPARLSKDERATFRRDLALAGASDEELGKLGMVRLREVATSLTSQGYSTPFNTKTRMPELIERIKGSHQKYVDSGGVTQDDLEDPSGKGQATEISKRVRVFTREIARAALRTVEEEMAEAVKEADRISGGQDTRLRDRSGRERIQRGKVQRGAAFGGEKDVVVDEAERTLKMRGERISHAALDQALRFTTGKRVFDPYSQDVRSEVRGSGEQAQAARRGLASLTRATTALDKFAREVIDTRAALDKAQGGAETRRSLLADKEIKGTDRQRITDELESTEKRIGSLTEKWDSLSRSAENFTPQGTETFLSDEYRRGLSVREKSRKDYEDRSAQAEQERRERRLNETALGSATVDTLAGAKSFRGMKDYFVRMMPGLAPATGKQPGFRFTDQNRDPELLKPVNSAWRSYTSASRGLTDAMKAVDFDPNKVASEAKKVDNQISRLIHALQKALPDETAVADLNTLRDQVRKAMDKANRDVLGYDADLGYAPKDYGPQLSQAEMQAARNDSARRAKEMGRSLQAKPEGKEGIEASSISDAKSAASKKLAEHEQALAAAVKKTTAAQKELDRASADLSKSMSAEQKKRLEKLRGRVGQLDERIDSYSVQRATVSPGKQKFGLSRFERDAMGYPSKLGYGPPVAGRELDEIQGKENRAREARAKALREIESIEGSGDQSAKVRGAREAFEAAKGQERIARQTRDTQASILEGIQKQRAAAKASASDGGKGGGKSGGGKASGDGGGGPKDGKAAPTPPGGGDGFDRVVQAINRLHETVRKGVTVRAGKAKADGGDTQAAANKVEEQQKRREARQAQQAEGLQYSTPQARQKFFGDQTKDIQDLIGANNHLAAATELVRRGILNQAEAVRVFSSELNKDKDGTREFADSLRQNLGDATLVDKGALAKRRQKLAEDKAAAKQTKDNEVEQRRLRAQSNVQTVMGRLSSTTKQEVDDLRKLSAAGADNVRIMEQQIKVYQRMEAELRKQGFNAGQIRSQSKMVLGSTNAPGGKTTTADVDDIARAAKIRELPRDLQNEAAQAALQTGGLFGEQSAFTKAFFGNHGFWSRTLASTGTFIVRNFTAGFVFGLTNAMQDVIAQAIETESTFVRVSHALESTGRSAGSLRTELTQISTDYGVALRDVYTSAAGLTGVFESVEEIGQATRVVAQLEMISNGALSAQEAMGALASVTSAFGMQSADSLSHIADVLTVIQNRTGTNLEQTVEGVGRLSGLANQLGLSFEEVATYVAEISKKTNQTGAAAGEQFSRMLSVLQTGRGQASLRQNLGGFGIGEALDAGDYSSALEILLENYQGLTRAQQDNIATTIGGQRQAAATAALLHDGAEVLDTVRAAQDAKGEADERAAEISKQLNNQLQRFQQNMVNLGGALIRSGLLDVFGALLGGVNALVGGLNYLLSKFNDFKDSNAFTSFLGTVVMGLTGANLAIQLIKRSLAGLRATLGAQGALGAMRSIAGTGGLGTGQEAAKGRIRDLLPRRRIIDTEGYDARLGYHKRASLQQRDDFYAKNPELAGQDVGRVGRRIYGWGDRASALSERMSKYASDQRMRLGAAVPGSLSAVQRTAMGASAVAANASSKAMNGLSRGLHGLALSGVAAQAAMGALSAGLTFLIFELVRADQFKKDQEKAYEGSFGEESKLTEDQKRDRYIGKNDELNKENKKNLGGFTGFMRGLGSGIKGMLTGKSMDEVTNRSTGNIDDEKVLGQLHDAFQGNLNRLKDVANAPGATVEQLQAAQKDVMKDLDRAASEIQDNDSLSSEQKAAALADIEDSRRRMEGIASNLILTAMGMTNAQRLTLDSIRQINQLTPTLGQMGPEALQEYASTIATLIQDTGVDMEGAAAGMLGKLSQGGTQGEMAKVRKELTQLMINNLEAQYKATEDPDKRQEIKQEMLSLMGQLESITQEILQSEIDSATEMATFLRNTGDYAQAASAAKGAISALQAEASRYQQGDPRRLRALEQARQIQYQATQDLIAGDNKDDRLSAAMNRNSTRAAGLELAMAERALNRVREADSGATAEDILSAQERYYQAVHASADAQNRQRQSGFTRDAARTMNDMAKASIELAGAWDAVTFARNQFGIGSAEENEALARYYQAQQQQQQQLQNYALAMANRYMEQNFGPADSIGRAQYGVEIAKMEQKFAAQNYGKDSAQYEQATQRVIQAQRGVNDLLYDVSVANMELSLAIAEAGGDVNKAADIRLAMAQKNLRRILAQGGEGSPEAIRAQAAQRQAEAAKRDTTLQYQLDTIDFHRQMEHITAAAAIGQLQEILKQKDLTEAQRRSILLKIKGLEDEINGAFSNNQFNLGDIKLPTVYEIRRSLGIGQYETIMGENVAAIRQMRDVQASQLVGSLTTATGFTGGGGAGPLRTSTSSSVAYDNSTNTVILQGVSFEQVQAYIQQYLGRPSQTVRTTAVRRA